MDPQLRARADARFERLVEETGARDPREFYRGMLRELRALDEERYETAVADFRDRVLRAIAENSGDPLQSWLQFGLRLAESLHPGRAVIVDELGRSRAYTPPPSWKDLILHLPDEGRVRALPVGLPPELSGAQQATVDLLCQGRVKLPDP